MSATNKFLILATILITAYSACNATYPYSYSGNCYQECPWNNTLITYLDNSTKTCVTSTSYSIKVVKVVHFTLMTPLKLVSLVFIS